MAMHKLTIDNYLVANCQLDVVNLITLALWFVHIIGIHVVDNDEGE